MSAPHIYISALPLSPKTSIVHKLYKKYACPSSRVVQGSPTSWDPVLATTNLQNSHGEVVWSPCSRFIAIATTSAIEILDALTLEKLNTLEHLNIIEFDCDLQHQWLGFSPDGCTFTQLEPGKFTSWDLQTGIPVSTVFLDDEGLGINSQRPLSYVCSMDKKILAVLTWDPNTIKTYDLLSGSHMHSYAAPEGQIIAPIWTYGEFLHFVTIKPGVITVWEAAFTLIHTPGMLESLTIPDEVTNFEGKQFLFLPSLCQLAIANNRMVVVWDCHKSIFLLKSQTPLASLSALFNGMSFSSDGDFFSLRAFSGEVYVWKRSLTSYVLHQKLALNPKLMGQHLSPNGRFIIDVLCTMVRLWHTRDQNFSPPSIPNHDYYQLIVGFSPNEVLAAFARYWEKTVTILNLQSGNLQLIKNVGLKIECLRVTESTVMVSGKGKMITWNLPIENYTNARASVNDSIQTVELDCSNAAAYTISPDLSRIVVMKERGDYYMQIHETSTGKQLAGIRKIRPHVIALKEDKVWCLEVGGSVEGWKIIEDCGSSVTKLVPLPTTAHPPQVFPWQSPHGYEVTDDGWVLSSTQKRLLWLPHQWRSLEQFRTWSGQFLGLGHPELPEAVILEF